MTTLLGRELQICAEHFVALYKLGWRLKRLIRPFSGMPDNVPVAAVGSPLDDSSNAGT